MTFHPRVWTNASRVVFTNGHVLTIKDGQKIVPGNKEFFHIKDHRDRILRTVRLSGLRSQNGWTDD